MAKQKAKVAKTEPTAEEFRDKEETVQHLTKSIEFQIGYFTAKGKSASEIATLVEKDESFVLKFVQQQQTHFSNQSHFVLTADMASLADKEKQRKGPPDIEQNVYRPRKKQ